MKILLDSTYLFPIIGIEINEWWTKSHLSRLLKNENYNLYYGDLSLFEIFTKSMRLILQKKISLSMDQIQKGINGLVNSTKFQKINWWEHLFESEIILELRRIHSDSIDCELFYLAVVNCDIFATFDETMVKKIKANSVILDWIKGVNPNFRIWKKNLHRNPEKILF